MASIRSLRANFHGSEPGADRGPHAGSPRGVVDATGPSELSVCAGSFDASGSDSHRGFSPVSEHSNRIGNRLNGFQFLSSPKDAALKPRRESETSNCTPTVKK